MKHFMTWTLLSLSFSAFATPKIQEELYVPGLRPEAVKEMIQTGSVIIDHVSRDGFEIYGSKGLKSYLDQKGIPYLDMREINEKVLSDYPSFEDMTMKLQALVARYPNILQLQSIGKTGKGKDMWMVKISDNVSTDEVEPEFKYISSMHGDEITGREMTMSLIQEMAQKYGSDPEITSLINNTEIFIMPSMNPDGTLLHQRANASGIDLNRNFPELTHGEPNSPAGRGIEDQNVMKWQAAHQVALSANFHGGSLVANYPWDAKYDLFPFDELVKSLSLGYAERNPEMHRSSEFSGGITNGAAWYVVTGGMQDWSYNFHNDLQITLEVSETKWPDYAQMPAFYRSNRDSMMWYMKQVHHGAGFKLGRSNLEGTVAIHQTSPESKDWGTYAFKGSEFYKVLPEGEYSFVVTDKSGTTQTVNATVAKDVVRSNGNYSALR